MTTDATTAPRRSMSARRRFSEQLHTLVDEQTRAYILGMASLAAAAGGYATPREAEETRDLLDEAIAARYEQNPRQYETAVKRGRKVMAARAAARKA
jgi:hypothetical protein